MKFLLKPIAWGQKKWQGVSFRSFDAYIPHSFVCISTTTDRQLIEAYVSISNEGEKMANCNMTCEWQNYSRFEFFSRAIFKKDNYDYYYQIVIFFHIRRRITHFRCMSKLRERERVIVSTRSISLSLFLWSWYLFKVSNDPSPPPRSSSRENAFSSLLLEASILYLAC